MSPSLFSPSLHVLLEPNHPVSPWCPCAILPTHFLPISWCQLRAHTQSQLPSVLITLRSCHHPWSAREALGTPGPHPSSECDLRVRRACGGGPCQLSLGLGEGVPILPPPSSSSLSCSPHAGGGSQENLDNDTETDSLVSAQRERPRRRDGPEHSASSLNRYLPYPHALSTAST